MLQRKDGIRRGVRWEQDLTDRNGCANSKRDALMQELEEVHVGIAGKYRQTVPEVQAEGLARIDLQQALPNVFTVNAQKGPQVREERLKCCVRQRRLLGRRDQVCEQAREQTWGLQALKPGGAQGLEDIGLSRLTPKSGATSAVFNAR